jgi:DUF4097 and DUF4098 domain-containing protein YvlB
MPGQDCPASILQKISAIGQFFHYKSSQNVSEWCFINRKGNNLLRRIHMSWLTSLIISGLISVSFGGSGQSAANRSLQNVQTAEVVADAPRTGGEETERFEQTYPFNANGKIALSNVNGSVTIDVWDRNEVKVEYTKTANDKESLAWVEVRIENNKDSLQIEADYNGWKNHQNRNRENWRNGELNVIFKLTVPRGAVLDEIETVNGSVFISNLTNSCKVSTVNGMVTAKNLRGSANLSTVNGYVNAEFDRLEAGANISLETVNGKALLTIPSDSSATIKADTLNGVISNDFGLPVSKGKYVGRNLHGRVGSGDVKINLTSVNGPLSIGRKQDGKTLSPATNMLVVNKEGKKNGDDDDVDVDVDVDVNLEPQARANSARMEREVKRAARDAARTASDPNVQRTMDKAMEAADREMRRNVDAAQQEAMNAGMEAARAVQAEVQAKIEAGAFGALSVPGTSSGLPVMSKRSETFAVKGMPKVTVNAKNCSVVVKGWERPEVQYSLTTYSRNGGKEESTHVHVENTDSKVDINVRNDVASNRFRLEVYVPKRTNLRISSDREIRLDGVGGTLELNAVNEPINVRESDGVLILSSIGGNVRVVGFTGEATSGSQSGMLSFEGDFSKFTANTQNGTVMLTVPDGVMIPGDIKNVFAEGFSVVKEDSQWKVGEGGETFRVTAGPRGKVIVRNSVALKIGLLAGVPLKGN